MKKQNGEPVQEHQLEHELHVTGGLIPELVHARAVENPDAVAVVALDRTLTYGELDARTDLLAADLHARGAGVDTVVGVCGQRSAETIVSELAVMKAGAAFLPLDSSYPKERLSFILNDAECPFVLLGPGVDEELVAGTATPMRVNLSGRVTLSPRLPLPLPSPEQLAYVIYTSGSTGRPKGVEITHASLMSLVRWHKRAFGIRPTDRASQVAAIGFDAAVWEVWPYLAAGASLHIPSEEIRTDPEALREWLLSERIDVSFVPTPMAERLLALKWPSGAALRCLLTGGDTLHGYPPPGLPFRLVNNYGPTECTVVATSGVLDPYDQPDRLPTIGRPIDGCVVYLLDAHLKEVPIGAVGEMYIGGAGVARGYRNRPDLTAERFVPSPFVPGARLYKTGDLGRRLSNGQIAFAGRTDEQVKIRGFRIEPNEIVAALNEHPCVFASAVVASDLGDGEKQLVAYVVLSADAAPKKSELQEALCARLPDYMVPPVFVRLQTLPLGVHGKVDRSALPEPDPKNTLRDTEHTAPRTEVEKYVAGLLEQLLRVSVVSVDDNFFLLGGHSLMATQLITRICDAFGIKLALRHVFESPTVEQLSARVEELLLEKLEATNEPESPHPVGSEQPITVPS